MQGPAVAFNGLTKRFGAKTAVDHVDLEIPNGSFFGICGPNGAGKTTLLRMATGLLQPDEGTVEIVGTNVWSDPAAAKRRFGVVPDNPRMFDRLTGRELIEFNGLLRDMEPNVIAERSRVLLRLLALEDDADTLVADYSLGMTKKAAIACALLHDPRVLFLDEPFAGIDPVARQVLEKILRRHNEAGGTVVFSDHAMDVVSNIRSNHTPPHRQESKGSSPDLEKSTYRPILQRIAGGGSSRYCASTSSFSFSRLDRTSLAYILVTSGSASFPKNPP